MCAEYHIAIIIKVSSITKILPYTVSDDACNKSSTTCSKPECCCKKYYDPDVVQKILAWPDIYSFVGSNSWFRLLRLGCSTYPRLVKEFLSSLTLTHSSERYLQNFQIKFLLDGVRHTLPIDELNEIYGIEHAQTRTYFREFDAAVMWKKMTTEDHYDSKTAKADAIRNPTLRYMHYVIANTIFGRSRGVHKVCPWDIFALRGLTMGNQINMLYFMFKHFEQVVILRYRTIVIGGFVTPLAQYLGVNLDLYDEVDGSQKVDMLLLNEYGMITPHGTPQWLLHFDDRAPLLLPNTERVRLDKEENWKLESEG